MRIKQNRTWSFIIIAAIYLSASVLGYYLYNVLPYSAAVKLLTADVAATVYVFIFSLLFGNASVYDPYWSVQPMVILAFYACGASLTPYRLLLLCAVMLWGARLTANWAYTFHGLEHQDWRYTMLHEKTGVFYPLINFVGIHLVPTLVVYGCILPAVCAFIYEPKPNIGSIIFALLSYFAFTMQGVADIQMHSFKKRKKTDKQAIYSFATACGNSLATRTIWAKYLCGGG